MARDGSWMFVDDKKLADLKEWNEISHIKQYTKPGMYYVETWSQRCSRNCCSDRAFEVISPANRIIEIKEKMQELANDLKYAKEQL